MGVYNFAFPVLPGKEDEARKFAKEAVGSHAEHYTSLMRERIKDVGGADMREPMPGPQPELIMEWPA